MTRPITFLFLLGMGLTTIAGFGQPPTRAALRVFLNEVQPGVLSAPQYCTLVFHDRHFHTERANIKNGRDSDRKVYEGQLSDTDWNALVAIIDSKEFRGLNVPRTVPPLVMQDTHPYTISVAREKTFQNMEFMDTKSLKPFESQVRPLLQWWKSFRGHRAPESSSPPDARCALDSTHAVFAQ